MKYESAELVCLDPTDIFSMMVVSSAFDPGSGSIEEKRQIFGRVWARDIPWLRRSFNPAGMDPSDGSYGFGFLVEAFARASGRLPKQNTEKGKRVANNILSELHSGEGGKVNLGSRQSNSDFLWVDLTGRRIVVS